MNYEINMHLNTIAVIRLYGELDHHATEKIRDQISRTILQGSLKTIIWNLEKLNFMDSSGIGLILGRMRELRAVNGQTIILNPSQYDEKNLSIFRINFVYDGWKRRRLQFCMQGGL